MMPNQINDLPTNISLFLNLGYQYNLLFTQGNFILGNLMTFPNFGDDHSDKTCVFLCFQNPLNSLCKLFHFLLENLFENQRSQRVVALIKSENVLLIPLLPPIRASTCFLDLYLSN